MSRAPSRRALFLDRDGTLIEDAHYLADASRVVLLPDAAEAIRPANEAAVPVFIVTNQSGIGRGLISEVQYEAVRARTEQLLEDAGAHVTATYHCPHAPVEGTSCRCRKPGTALYEWAAAEHGITLNGSAFIGDRWRDVAPALTLEGIGILVPSTETPPDDVDRVRMADTSALRLATGLRHAVSLALAHIAQCEAAGAPVR